MNIQLLEAGLVGLLSADAPLIGLIGTRVWRDPAPEGESHPLLVFRCSRRKVDTLDTDASKDNGFFEVEVGIKAIDEGKDQTAASAACERAVEVLVNGTLEVPGFTIMGVQRSGTAVSYPEFTKGRTFQHVRDEVTVWLQKD